MVHCCCVPGCSTRSDRESQLSFFTLPLTNKVLLKRWVHVIRRTNLPLNRHTRICSRHFVNAEGRRLFPEEVPSLLLPGPSLASSVSRRKPPKDRTSYNPQEDLECSEDEASYSAADYESSESEEETDKSLSTQTDLAMEEMDTLVSLRDRVAVLEDRLEKAQFRLCNITDDDSKVTFYTGFPSFSTLNAFFIFLGPAVHNLKYSKTQEQIDTVSGIEKKRLRPRALPPIEELFMTLIRLRLGLLEQDLAYRFNMSQSTVSRIVCTWINFQYLKLKELPLWPPREIIRSNMPAQFKSAYPNTRVVLDATEVYIEQPHLPELQQMTFSNYKNHNTFKGLVGISPDGVVTFVSPLFSGSISDKSLTRKSGVLDLLEEGDSVMADRGFDIEEDLLLIGVKLNIPPFLRGKSQLSEEELVQTRRIASLRIHVERAMERIKNFHIFDKCIPVSLTDIADRIFIVCCVLTNFQQPLVK